MTIARCAAAFSFFSAAWMPIPGFAAEPFTIKCVAQDGDNSSFFPGYYSVFPEQGKYFRWDKTKPSGNWQEADHIDANDLVLWRNPAKGVLEDGSDVEFRIRRLDGRYVVQRTCRQQHGCTMPTSGPRLKYRHYRFFERLVIEEGTCEVTNFREPPKSKF